MRKIGRRDELAELDEDATDGQFADYVGAELSGEYGSWNIGIVEYECPKCNTVVQMLSDNLQNYDSLIISWHEKSSEGDCFSQFVFQYLSFIAHLKNNLFYKESSDRRAIQRLKQDKRIEIDYLKSIKDDQELHKAWQAVIDELKENPLLNSSVDLDSPEISIWWNSSDIEPDKNSDKPKGMVHSLNDWGNMVEFWYSVRNNLFHGGKEPSVRRDIFLVNNAFVTLRPLMDNEIQKLHR